VRTLKRINNSFEREVVSKLTLLARSELMKGLNRACELFLLCASRLDANLLLSSIITLDLLLPLLGEEHSEIQTNIKRKFFRALLSSSLFPPVFIFLSASQSALGCLTFGFGYENFTSGCPSDSALG
jgi:hypothetical protein